MLIFFTLQAHFLEHFCTCLTVPTYLGALLRAWGLGLLISQSLPGAQHNALDKVGPGQCLSHEQITRDLIIQRIRTNPKLKGKP